MRSLPSPLCLLLLAGACADTPVTPDASSPPLDARPRGRDAMTRFDAAPLADAALPDSAPRLDSGGGQDATPADATNDDAGPAADARPGDTGAPDAALTDSGAAGCMHCVADPVTWGSTGGRVATRRSATVDPCRTFGMTEQNLRTNTSTSCSSLVACADPNEVSMDDLQGALADPDVAAAFQAAPITYGRDLRAVDLPIFMVEQAGQTFLVGRPCESTPGCNPIPAGVQRLVSVLNMLQVQQLTRGDCPTVFP